MDGSKRVRGGGRRRYWKTWLEGSLRTRWETLFLFLTAVLTSTILVKLGQVQYLEILYVVQIAVLLRDFSRNNWEMTTTKLLLTLGVLYAVFLAVAITLAVLALQRDFYIVAGLTPLKGPLVIALLRGAELVASVVVMLYLTQVFRGDLRKTRFAMRVYFWTGLASALYSLVSYPFARAEIFYGGTAPNLRARGFFNEGGPYGLYLISVLLVGVSLYQMRWETRRWLLWSAPVLFVTFVASESKAAAVAVVALGVVDLLLLRKAAQRFAVAAVIAGTFLAVSQVVDVTAGLRLYRQAGLTYERVSHFHKGDVSYVIGRVAAAFIVPRMIAEHPLAGVGWGNYGLVRNAPEYRGAAAWVDFSDDPALGLVGLAAELGIPLTSLLVLCLLLPLMYLQRRRVPFHMMNLAVLQPIVHLFGAQLNMTYPWVVTAFALGLGLRLSRAAEAPASAMASTKLDLGPGSSAAAT